MAQNAFAIIAGAGSGSGASIARRFASTYSLALLARTPASFDPLVKEINEGGGHAVGISADVSDPSSVTAAFERIKQEFQGKTCAAVIYNASGGFVRKPFLETKLEEYSSSFSVTFNGALNVSHASIPLLLQHVNQSSAKYSPTLIFTGATASIKSNAQMSTFAAPKWALRALSQSLAREFAPQGVHVAHAVIDGAIDIPKSQELLANVPKEGRVGPDEIADMYWMLHTQGRQGFTYEIDIRGMLEKW